MIETFDFDGIRIDTVPEVPKWFWYEFGNAAGVFQMGEVFNGSPSYVGGYQGYLTALFNYPLFFNIRDVWISGNSMYEIKERYNSEESYFNDIDALGVFLDNHDNSRFLHNNDDRDMFTSALIFTLTSRGIPFYYYGSEQYYDGGKDPRNRKELWSSGFDTSTELYQITSIVNAVRKEHKFWLHSYVERYIDNNFLAYTRGEAFIALTNTHSTI
mmetsp:Transcript_3241/g.3188  ORF Transcript_3241/g.3188 Transcript_3241/m.3188 type:complete len:214 (-) Transcript_3241:236-877(-)